MGVQKPDFKWVFSTRTLRGKVFVPLPLFFELKALQTLGKPANKKSSVFLKKISKIRFDILCITFKPPEMPALKVVI